MIHEHPFVLMDVTPLNSPLKHMEQQIIDMTTPFRCNYITKDTKFTEKKVNSRVTTPGVGKAGAIRDLMAHLIKSQHDVATCSKAGLWATHVRRPPGWGEKN